jgi:3-isopropylmalate dehydrogenase
MKKIIAVLAGDGIGQEVMPQAIKILNAIANKYQHQFIIKEGYIGGAAYEKMGAHFPEETKVLCQNADAILFGSVGGPAQETQLPKWKDCEKNSILALRKTFKLQANIRPARVYQELAAICPLKENLISQGLEFIIVRELVGDIYFGEHRQWLQDNKRYASDVAEYNEDQIATVTHSAFQLAKNRRQKVTSVDKANVLDTSKLWREIVSEIAQEYPTIQLEHMLVDNCAMQLIINPKQFDVIVTSNLFGDILSDAAAALPGSLGLMPSASLNENGFGLYEPSGGSAPDIAGKNIANPIAQILSVALMLRYSFELHQEADAIEKAVLETLKAGFRTKDIAKAGEACVGTSEIAAAIETALCN